MAQTSSYSLDRRLAGFSTYETTPDEALALFREARASGRSVFWSDTQGGHYVFLDHADVKAAHIDWETYRSGPQVLRPLAERPRFPPIEYDPPEHASWRKLFAEVLNPDTATLHEAAVREDVEELLDDIARRGTFDLQADFAEQVPLLALCHLIGFDKTKRSEVRRYTVELHAASGDPQKAATAFQAFAEFGLEEVHARLQEPRDDFLTKLAHARLGDRPLTAMEVGATMNSLLNAGHGTTVSGLTSLLWEVLRSPAIRSRLIEDPFLIPFAVEESMRLHTPFFGIYRMSTRDVTVGGVDIPAGSSVQLMWAAANRDPKVFRDPDTFDLDRDLGSNRLLTFGFGIHACMGQPMARMEMNVALGALLRRLPDIELVAPDAVKHEFAGSETALIKSLPARMVP
jgi:cytochrome P450